MSRLNLIEAIGGTLGSKKTSSALIGIAGVHYVVSELSRRGWIALPTIRNTEAYDIIVVGSAGKRHANFQVKTSSRLASFWPMPPSGKIKDGPRDYYTFLAWVEKEGHYEVYLLGGAEAKREVKHWEGVTLRRKLKGTRLGVAHSLHLGKRGGEKARRWRRAWEQWHLE